MQRHNKLSLFSTLILVTLLCGCQQSAHKQTVSAITNGLSAEEFPLYWVIESESDSSYYSFYGDTLEIVAPKGFTLWRKDKMSGNVRITYSARIMDEGKPTDRLSDLNCFWMASDPHADNIFTNSDQRSGKFGQYYSLQMYYVGYGGNYNSTTRFRRYSGDSRGIDDASFRPEILTEYTDSAHLLIPNHWYHIELSCINGRVQYIIDGNRLVDYIDPSPLTSGWFGFRTTWSRAQITDFSYTAQ